MSPPKTSKKKGFLTVAVARAPFWTLRHYLPMRLALTSPSGTGELVDTGYGREANTS